MSENNFVYGDSTRIFVNTDMGCDGQCSYCYLPSLGLNHSEIRITGEEAIKRVENSGMYIPGENGTIISIGCYSECMDEYNINETLKIVEYFLKKKNYVQLATKKIIPQKFYEKIIKVDDVNKLLWIYISLPVIKEWDKIEFNTVNPEQRISNFERCTFYNIHSVLYVKPFLGEFTMRNFEKYIDISTQYNVDIVLGELLTTNKSEFVQLVGENRLFECSNKELVYFKNELLRYSKVYEHSIDCIKAYRG